MHSTDFCAEDLRRCLNYSPITGVFTWTIKVSRKTVIGQAAGRVSVGKSGYAMAKIQVYGTEYIAARLAWLHVTGQWPTGEIDHRDGDSLNNAWANLRDGTHRANLENRRTASKTKISSPLMGAYWRQPYRGRQGSWYAKIVVDGKSVFLGNHTNDEAAHLAYLEAKRNLHAGCTI